jgi:hypothetical protein
VTLSTCLKYLQMDLGREGSKSWFDCIVVFLVIVAVGDNGFLYGNDSNGFESQSVDIAGDG